MPDNAQFRLIEDDPSFGLKAGDVLECARYALDPEKLTVIRRVSDGFDPCCNVYRSQVERIGAEPAAPPAPFAVGDTVVMPGVPLPVKVLEVRWENDEHVFRFADPAGMGDDWMPCDEFGVVR